MFGRRGRVVAGIGSRRLRLRDDRRGLRGGNGGGDVEKAEEGEKGKTEDGRRKAEEAKAKDDSARYSARLKGKIIRTCEYT